MSKRKGVNARLDEFETRLDELCRDTGGQGFKLDPRARKGLISFARTSGLPLESIIEKFGQPLIEQIMAEGEHAPEDLSKE